MLRALVKFLFYSKPQRKPPPDRAPAKRKRPPSGRANHSLLNGPNHPNEVKVTPKQHYTHERYRGMAEQALENFRVNNHRFINNAQRASHIKSWNISDQNTRGKVFEKIILICFEERDAKIWYYKNQSLGADGGIDLWFRMGSEVFAVQCKCIHGAAKAADLFKFRHDIQVLSQAPVNRVTGGFFIHTGTTPKSVYGKLGRRVQVVSGDALIDFLLGKGLSVTI